MLKKFEKTYGTTVKGAFKIVNPIKKMVIKTHCLVHKFINYQAVEILKKENYNEQYEFYLKYIKSFNEGVVWADQDFKSINHFFHYKKKNGMFGFSNALAECKGYYVKAVNYYNENDIERSMFYLGAACHLVQDSTVPQHVNKQLLNNHRPFELWIIEKVINENEFSELSSLIQYSNLDDYIINNSRKAYNIYINSKDIQNREIRYHKIASEIIKLAQSTTSGVLLKFYSDNVSFKK